MSSADRTFAVRGILHNRREHRKDWQLGVTSEDVRAGNNLDLDISSFWNTEVK